MHKPAEIKAQITACIIHLYDRQEAEAIAKCYMEDKLLIKNAAGFSAPGIKKLPDYFQSDMELLAKGTPLQYVTGIQYFAGLPFKVNSAVLIPRPETEELVEWISNDLKTIETQVTLLEIGTGSGCIPVTLKLKNPSAAVYATDISENALKTATENAAAFEVQIYFFKDDILNPGFILPGGFDLIVSNPPYIPFSDGASLAAHVINFEPHEALFTPDKEPILFYKAICRYAIKHLNAGGSVYFEVHPDHCRHVVEELNLCGFSSIITRNDLSGHLRFVKATWPGNKRLTN